MKGNKGITLIALVITIIIMLILTAVTVTMVNQGGLFTRGREAQLKMQYSAEREELLIYTLGDYYNPVTNQLNISELASDTAFTNNWNIVSSTADYIEVTRKGNSSGVTYKIYKAGGAITDNYAEVISGEETTNNTPVEQTGEKVYYLNNNYLGEVYIVGLTCYSHEGSRWHIVDLVSANMSESEFNSVVAMVNDYFETNYTSSQIGLYGSGSVGFLKVNNDWYFPASQDPIVLEKFEVVEISVSDLEAVVGAGSQSGS